MGREQVSYNPGFLMKRNVRTAETSEIEQYVYNLIVCLHSILFQTCSRNMQITRSININSTSPTPLNRCSKKRVSRSSHYSLHTLPAGRQRFSLCACVKQSRYISGSRRTGSHVCVAGKSIELDFSYFKAVGYFKLKELLRKCQIFW